MVKKTDIAHRLGLHVATVSRILNQVPGYRASKETVEKVFEVAREMGYDFERQKRFYRRRHRRRPTDMLVKLRAKQGNRVATHSARMVNIGEGGALLCNFSPTLATLPLREEDLVLEVVSGGLAGVEAACEVVRVGGHGASGGLGVCVNMKGLSPKDTTRIRRYVRSPQRRNAAKPHF